MSPNYPFPEVHWFRSTAPYIHAHRGRTFVIAFTGEVIKGAKFSHLIHDINEQLSTGLRFGWFRDDDASRVVVNDLSGRASYFEVTAGLNWKPLKWVTLRPEVRYDWADSDDFDPYDNNSDDDQFIVAGDIIIHFFYYGLSDGTCPVRYDNERGKGDHRHWGDHEAPYRFVDIETLITDFLSDVAKAREDRR